jgi:hypothetical protein
VPEELSMGDLHSIQEDLKPLQAEFNAKFMVLSGGVTIQRVLPHEPIDISTHEEPDKFVEAICRDLVDANEYPEMEGKEE